MTKSVAEQLAAGLLTEAEARAAARAERAAIRAAAPIYVAKPAKSEAQAWAEAEQGAIVESETPEAKARAARAAKARAALPAIEYVPAPAKPVVPETEAEAKARQAEARWHASIARELARQEQAEARQAAARQARRDAVVSSAETMFRAMGPAELAKAARKARASRKLAEAEARAAYLAESGLTEAEAREQELLAEATEALIGWAAIDAIATRKPRKDAGMHSRLSPAELAAVAEWTRAGLSSPAARAGRQALEAIGPVASAMVVTSRKARKLAIHAVVRVPKVEVAEARAGKAEAALEAARARQAEAEAAVAAAEAKQAVAPIRKAEAEANRLAELTRKAAARAERAAEALAEARKLAGRPASDGWTFYPVESFKLAEAGKAAELALRTRSDRMPARYADRGPAAKGKPKLNDNTARLALAELTKLSEAEIDAMWDETWRQIRELLAAKRAAEAAAKAAAKAESEAARKAYKAAHERDRRRKQR